MKKKRTFVSHRVVEMDESMVQRCIYCGQMISDYSSSLWPSDQPPPKGFDAGEVYVAKGFPTITTSIQPFEEYTSCLNEK